MENETMPRHIAIIMDGNGRWANKRKLPRAEGHRRGASRITEVIDACARVGVEYVTLYAFSWENWNRPKGEVNSLMRLLNYFFNSNIDKIIKKNVRLLVIGRLDKLREYSPNNYALVKESIEKTKNNTGITVILALSYGSREEITDAVRELALQVKEGKIDVGQINPETISKFLYTAGIPDPDLLIRTSGEIRISNFLLWQISYTELIFVDKLWPDFSKADLLSAVNIYSERQRRYGKLL